MMMMTTTDYTSFLLARSFGNDNFWIELEMVSLPDKASHTELEIVFMMSTAFLFKLPIIINSRKITQFLIPNLQLFNHLFFRFGHVDL
jgi:hypothetical protein